MQSKRIILSEHQEQVNFVTEVHYQYRNDETFIPLLFFSTLNGAWLGGGKSFALWNKHKKEGAKKGVADILYLQPRGYFTFMAVEMKRSDRRDEEDGGLTPEEKEWLTVAGNNGACVLVAYTAEQATQAFDRYMGLEVRV